MLLSTIPNRKAELEAAVRQSILDRLPHLARQLSAPKPLSEAREDLIDLLQNRLDEEKDCEGGLEVEAGHVTTDLEELLSAHLPRSLVITAFAAELCSGRAKDLPHVIGSIFAFLEVLERLVLLPSDGRQPVVECAENYLPEVLIEHVRSQLQEITATEFIARCKTRPVSGEHLLMTTTARWRMARKSWAADMRPLAPPPDRRPGIRRKNGSRPAGPAVCPHH